MPYIFSEKQINHAYHLLTEHEMNFSQLADIMGTNIRNTHHLIRCVWQKYPKPHKPKPIAQPQTKKYVFDTKPIDTIKEITGHFVRPKAEYSNRRLYDLI